jgi:glycosyltransferase involved in cell wall biosynthesis
MNIVKRVKAVSWDRLPSHFRARIHRIRARIHRLRASVREWPSRVSKFIIHSSWRPLPRSQGERLVEQTIWICGLPLFVRRKQRSKYRIALLIDEFFGGWDTGIGGYGALARKYICKFLPSDDLQIDVLLDARGTGQTQGQLVDQTMLYRLPRDLAERNKWLNKQAYNLFLSIEMTYPSFEIVREYQTDTPFLYWIQDPRDLTMYQSRLRTVNRLRDGDWAFMEHVSGWMQQIMKEKRVRFISQGESLSPIARSVYRIPETMPIVDLANPVEIDFDYRLTDARKENKIILLGRLEAQKRAWIFCELAKRMPQYEFYVLGATGKGRDELGNARALQEYRNEDGSSKIKNLHFTGHVDGAVKHHHIKTAKLLANTSIWEGIPVSWLEALSYGTLIVSAFDRDSIVERFGTFVGEIAGDGTEEADLNKFAAAIEYWMTHNKEREETAQRGIEYVRERHSISRFVSAMRDAIQTEL